MREVAARYTVELLVDGVRLEAELLRLLEAVGEEGSLLRAARRLGVPYSRAWDMVARAERRLGARLLETRRGGSRRGGASLTPEARELLETYREARHRLERCVGPLEAPRRPSPGPWAVVAYSSDPLLEAVLQRLRGEGLNVEAACMGSGLALAMLSLGEADAACIHLYDPETGVYNRPFLERSWVPDPVLLGGYERELVLALRPGLEERYSSPREALRDAASGRLAIVARNRGSYFYLILVLFSRDIIFFSNIFFIMNFYTMFKNIFKSLYTYSVSKFY
jgi:putative molybdopterin biosynthesis protein